MIKSMTAFASCEKKLQETTLSWEMRSVNHRYLDASIYLPEGLSNKDSLLKEILRKKLGRGKVDAKLVIKPVDGLEQDTLKVNERLVNELFDAQKSISSLVKDTPAESLVSLSTMEILQFSGVLENSELDYSKFDKEIVALFKETLSLLTKSREGEGGRLKEMLVSRAKSIQQIVSQVQVRRPVVVEKLRDKLIKKLSELNLEVDQGRLEQELAIQAQRLDVDEELDRLNSHIKEMYEVIERGEPVGRRLDFLMQELNREANTLGSKANDAETSKASVELKVLIEQMREQVMNIE